MDALFVLDLGFPEKAFVIIFTTVNDRCLTEHFPDFFQKRMNIFLCWFDQEFELSPGGVPAGADSDYSDKKGVLTVPTTNKSWYFSLLRPSRNLSYLAKSTPHLSNSLNSWYA
jgi:hypothetical protein